MGDSVKKYFEDMSDREIIDSKGFSKKDKYVQAVKEKYEQRSQTGIKKYNTTLERNDLNLQDWLLHLQEELMDATLYIERLKEEIGS
jgi:hypothetical protein